MPHPSHFTSRKQSQYPLYGRALWAPGPIWMGPENHAPQGFEPTPLSPYTVAIHEDARYTMINIRHNILIPGKLRYLAIPFTSLEKLDKTVFTTLTSKPLLFAHTNAHKFTQMHKNACKKNAPTNAFYIFWQHGNLLNISDVLYNLFNFSQNSVYFKILSFSLQIVCFPHPP
jgi:hypothetical protein